MLSQVLLSFIIVVKPETSLNYKLDLVIPDAVESAFIHLCDGLAKAAMLFFSVLRKCLVKISLKTLWCIFYFCFIRKMVLTCIVKLVLLITRVLIMRLIWYLVGVYIIRYWIVWYMVRYGRVFRHSDISNWSIINIQKMYAWSITGTSGR